MASDRQIKLDQQGGPPEDNPQDDMVFLREGGQTDYNPMRSPRGEPFDAVTTRPRSYEHRFIDVDLTPVPVAAQEDRSLVAYDYFQRQYNINNAAQTYTQEIDIVERGWIWEPLRISMFGTAAGNLLLVDGSSSGDNSAAFAVQAGVATLLGGIQSCSGVFMTPGTPLVVKALTIDANAPVAIGIWFRRLKWVWSPPKFMQEDTLTAEKEQRGVQVGS